MMEHGPVKKSRLNSKDTRSFRKKSAIQKTNQHSTKSMSNYKGNMSIKQSSWEKCATMEKWPPRLRNPKFPGGSRSLSEQTLGMDEENSFLDTSV
jgi:hypothetical protein